MYAIYVTLCEKTKRNKISEGRWAVQETDKMLQIKLIKILNDNLFSCTAPKKLMCRNVP